MDDAILILSTLGSTLFLALDSALFYHMPYIYNTIYIHQTYVA